MSAFFSFLAGCVCVFVEPRVENTLEILIRMGFAYFFIANEELIHKKNDFVIYSTVRSLIFLTNFYISH